jgi:selT/selW/selH-like putative selenoprotein
VKVNGSQVWSKHQAGRFPTPDEVIKKITALLVESQR